MWRRSQPRYLRSRYIRPPAVTSDGVMCAHRAVYSRGLTRPPVSLRSRRQRWAERGRLREMRGDTLAFIESSVGSIQVNALCIIAPYRRRSRTARRRRRDRGRLYNHAYIHNTVHWQLYLHGPLQNNYLLCLRSF